VAGTHAHYSPSGSERFHKCSGAPAFANTLPPEQRPRSGPAAQLGTAAHGLLETSLTDMQHPKEYFGRIIELVGEDEDFTLLKANAKAPKGAGRVWFIVDDDMVEGVSEAYEYVLNRCDELFIDPKEALTMEGRTNPLPDRDDTSGTADVTIDVFPDLLEVVDYKNGFFTVEHRDNPQLLSYLTGRAEDTGWRHNMYRITVVQPNAFHKEGTVRSFDISKEDLRAFQSKHRTAVERCDEAEADLQGPQKGVPTEAWQSKWLAAGDHCAMCATEAKCIVRQMWIQNGAKLDFMNAPPDDEAIDIEMQDLERAAQIASWGNPVSRYIASAKKYLNNAYLAGKPVPGKMVRSRTNRVLRPDLDMTPEEFAKTLVKEGFISDNERARLFKPTEVQLITGPAIEKLVPAKKRKEFAEKYLFKPEGSIEWAPEEDIRRPVIPADGAKKDFDGDIPEF
jgi:hypothetical protein